MGEVRLAAINKVLLTGRLTRDAEIRYVPAGTPVATLNIANNRSVRERDGSWKEETTFVTAVAMGREVEQFGPRLHQGVAVYLEGRLHTRSWEGREGGRRQILEIVIERLQVLDRPDEGEEKKEKGGVEGELPF